MLHSDPPLSLVKRIEIALKEVRYYRDVDDPAREFSWLSVCDRLLDMHQKLLEASGAFRPLRELDPELDARLTVHPQGVKYVKKQRDDASG